MAALLGAPATAAAAPIEFVEQRDRYMLFHDVEQTVEHGNWFERDPFLAAYGDVEAGFLAAHEDDSQLLVMFTTFDLPPPIGALYQAVANDVHGIGYEHIAPEDLVIPDEGNGYFDDTPNSQVYGFLHMNRWTHYLGGDPGGVSDNYISLVFGQELGHAWLAFVSFDQGQGPSRSMLGRANAHWSFYLDSGGSPVQGHDWVDNGDGTFTALKQDIYEYSDLDLYLMGLLPPDEVEPWFLLENPSNCIDSAAGDGSCATPGDFLFDADSYTVTATRRDLTIEDVIAAEGPRMPSWVDAPDSFDVSFILVTRPDDVLSEGEKVLLDAIIDRSIEIFDAQTRGYAHVVNRTAADGAGDTGGVADSGGSTTTGSDGGDGTGGDVDMPPGSGGLSGSGGDASEGSGGGAAAGDSDTGGCGCGSAPAAAHAAWLWLLAAARRRRRALVTSPAPAAATPARASAR
ncbi:MAG: hypothetical protein U0168_31915 [Nannocystaceae bacterium]